jgi:hypothetical protein
VIDAAALLADTHALVRALVDDLRAASAHDPETAAVIEREYRQAHAAGRTALTEPAWAEGLYAQVAVAWVLGAVFVRFCEDNALVPEPLLAGPGPRRAIALDHRSVYLQANPAHDDRHWLREIFTRYRALPATGEVFGEHNPIWLLAPSADGARRLVQKLQEIDPDTGELRHDFTDPTWDTRFLGDLYQDLSEHAKKTYALLQTPIFVEEFILDRTLEPALATFGLRETTAIDPTCGSGHFLLGIFARLFERWCDTEPATNRRELARRALDAIGGVDLNPFAASIARFRLLVAALRAGGDTRLADAPAYPIHIAVGDSLLHGDPPGRLRGTTLTDEHAGAAAHGYATEDVEAARALLSRSWHVVVGNPPYITVKDPALNSLYRVRYETCHRQYSLGVPFTERFFQLARPDTNPERAGYVGMITANSFMKREFGKKLIEQWVPAHDLTHVIDTSGAYIPGHGTPTVILFGRNRRPVAATVRAVMGIRGEPARPDDPEKGLVWSSIVELVDRPGSQSDYVSVVDLDRTRLAKHPWSIGGGGAAELKELLDRAGTPLTTAIAEIGFGVVTREDDIFRIGRNAGLRAGIASQHLRPLVAGEEVRDWRQVAVTHAIWPYESRTLVADASSTLRRFLWPWRAQLSRRVAYGQTQLERHLKWWEYSMFFRDRFRTPLSITFAFVATHNHFVLDRGGKVFNRSAPVIKLPEGADERRHLELLGVLNSSTACFWMQQVFHNKGGPGGGSSKDEKWHDFYEHDGTKLQALPLPRDLDATTAELLDRLAQELAAVTPAVVVASGVPSAGRLANARARYDEVRAEMIAAQERLDWEVYRRYGLVDEDLTTGEEPEPPLRLGERAFEIVLARRMAAGEIDTKWFAKLGAEPTTELPAHWPDSYRRLVERRIELIETDLDIGLIEQQETKRRWEWQPWDEQVKVALRGWLLDRLEDARYWPEPAAITTVARLAAEVRADDEFMQVARLYAGRDDVDAAALVDELARAEAVPYLAALRLTESGLRKYAQWLHTWELQRREDAGEDVGPIPVPPKYVKADFVGVAWERRGKLDVPKERFISYPGAERETDSSLPIGWAGWDHLARARALATWYLQAKRDGRDAAHLAPLLAGLAELVPWLQQWHDEPNPDPALDRPGTQIAALVDAELRALHLSAEQLAAWRPAPGRRGRRPRA